MSEDDSDGKEERIWSEESTSEHESAACYVLNTDISLTNKMLARHNDCEEIGAWWGQKISRCFYFSWLIRRADFPSNLLLWALQLFTFFNLSSFLTQEEDKWKLVIGIVQWFFVPSLLKWSKNRPLRFLTLLNVHISFLSLQFCVAFCVLVKKKFTNLSFSTCSDIFVVWNLFPKSFQQVSSLWGQHI